MLQFTPQSPKITGILMSADCAFGTAVCQLRNERDRSRFAYPQQVWDDLYGQPWRPDLAGERWYRNLIQIGYISREEPTDGKRTRTLQTRRTVSRRSR